MALRLSSSATTTPTMYLNRVADDTALSMEQKATCFKYLSVVLKNLADPEKSQDEKYRTLKLDNAKLQAGLFSIPAVMELLTTLVGFQTKSNDESSSNSILFLPLESLNQGLCQQILVQISDFQQRLSSSNNNNIIVNNNNSNKRIGSTGGGFEPKLSEKQKARRLLEEQQNLEKQKAKLARKQNLEMLKQDKLVRETDPNWKPGVSAACAKSGSGISTFRDRHGEN